MSKLVATDTVRVAILDEAPFCWSDSQGQAHGADVDVLRAALSAVGCLRVEWTVVSFGALIPGVLRGAWTINTPMFVTDERARQLRFTRATWRMRDSLLVRAADVASIDSLDALARSRGAKLAVVSGQVQHASALAAGVPAARILPFDTQDEALAALAQGVVDAYLSTALGNRTVLVEHRLRTLAAVDAVRGGAQAAPPAAYSLAPQSEPLAVALDEFFEGYVGSASHLALVAPYGFAPDDLARQAHLVPNNRSPASPSPGTM